MLPSGSRITCMICMISDMFPGLNLCCTGPAQCNIAAGYDQEYVGRALSKCAIYYMIRGQSRLMVLVPQLFFCSLGRSTESQNNWDAP